MRKLSNHEAIEILVYHLIPRSQIRIEMLKAISKFPKGFYRAMLFKEIKNDRIKLDHRVLNAELQRFQKRGLIKPVKGKQVLGKTLKWYVLSIGKKP